MLTHGNLGSAATPCYGFVFYLFFPVDIAARETPQYRVQNYLRDLATAAEESAPLS